MSNFFLILSYLKFAYAVAVHKGKLPSPFYYADALIYGFFFGIMVHAVSWHLRGGKRRLTYADCTRLYWRVTT